MRQAVLVGALHFAEQFIPTPAKIVVEGIAA